MLKTILGGLLITLGVGLGLYFGLWVCFIGGIMGIANAIDSHTITSSIVAWNVIKIILAGFVGGIVFYIPSALGMILISMD